MKILNLILTLVLFYSCAGPYKKCINGECAYYKDGKKLTDEEAAKESKWISKQIEEKKGKEEYQKKLRKAPKRKKGELIYIAILMPEIIAKGKITTDDKIEKYWTNLFKKDKTIKKIDENLLQNYKEKRKRELKGPYPSRDWFKKASKHKVPGEIYVLLEMSTKKFTGLNKRTKKLGKGVKIIFKAKMSSTYDPQEYILKEEVFNIFKNRQGLDRLAKKVKKTIKTKMRKHLPSAAWLKKNDPNSMNNKMNLKDLFK